MADQFDVEWGWQHVPGTEPTKARDTNLTCCVCGVRYKEDFDPDVHDVNVHTVCRPCFDAIAENGWGEMRME